MEFTIRKLEPGDKVTGLSLGNDTFTPLKTFLIKQSQKFQAELLAITYGAFDEKRKICGYVTILCAEIDLNGNQLINENVNYRYSTCPAIKIARLAVDRAGPKNLHSWMSEVSA